MNNEKVARLIRQGIAALSEALCEVEPGGADAKQGVSRSGAVGYVLDRYFNSVLANNEKDYEYFMARNPFIMPNPNVVEVFLKFLEL